MSLLLVLLALTASLSPLLTAAHLWQVKEWRWDRLLEHFRSEGMARQIFGIIRPLILTISLPVVIQDWLPLQTWTAAILTLLTGLGVLQLALERQPLPRWTWKAIALTTSSFAITAIICLILGLEEHSLIALILIPLFQPFALVLSWFLFYPLDRALKTRTLQRAEILREANKDLIVIGITGSVGKTTTKELLLHILAGRSAAATPAYVNTEMGVAQWMTGVLSAPKKPDILIVEMGAYARGEIALLCRIAKPTIGVITFIGTQHMALFGSQDALLKTKAELFQSLPTDGIAVLNADSPFADTLRQMAASRLVTVSTGERGDIVAQDIEETPTGIRFRAGDAMFSLPLHGTHNVSNVLLAIAAAEALGMKRREIAKLLGSFRPPAHTFSVRTVGSILLLDDTHNASAASFKAAIGWAKGQPMQEKVLLSSGLIELGETEGRVHASLGTEAAGVFQRVIFTHPRHAASFAQGFGKPTEVLHQKTPRIAPGSLLACIGRINEETVRRLLP